MRLFTDMNLEIGSLTTIDGEDFDHLRVLRIKAGDKLELCNPHTQVVFHCKVVRVDRDEASVMVVSLGIASSEPSFKVTLFQAVPKLDKMDVIIQKCVELGVFKIVPIITARTITHPANAGIKARRWGKISKMAAQQSQRDIIPQVGSILKFGDMLEGLKNYGSVYLMNESEENLLSSQAFKDAQEQDIAIIVGPEGGFEASEVEQLCNCGAQSVSLGRRRLRVETAALAALAVLMSARGEL